MEPNDLGWLIFGSTFSAVLCALLVNRLLRWRRTRSQVWKDLSAAEREAMDLMRAAYGAGEKRRIAKESEDKADREWEAARRRVCSLHKELDRARPDRVAP